MPIEFKEFLKPELLLLIPVIYIIGMITKRLSFINDKYIPLITTACSLILTFVYVFATSSLKSYEMLLLAIFESLTQSILISGTATFTNQLIKQFGKKEVNENG